MSTPWPPDLLVGHRVGVQPGASIFSQGDRIQSVDLVHSGLVNIHTRREGQRIHLGVRTGGHLLGSVSAILGEIHLFSAVAMTTCSMTRVPVDHFHNLRESNFSLGLRLQELLASEINSQLDSRAAVGAGNSRARLEQLCVDFVRATGTECPDGSFKAQLTVAVTELAVLVGTTHEHVSRLLSALEAEKILRREKHVLLIPADSPLKKRVDDRKRLERPLTTGAVRST